MGDQDNIAENLRTYIQGFTAEVREIFERFDFHLQLDRPDKPNLLYIVCERFAQIDLHPKAVSNADMGEVSAPGRARALAAAIHSPRGSATAVRGC